MREGKKLKLLLTKIEFHEEEALRKEAEKNKPKAANKVEPENEIHKIPVAELYQKWQESLTPKIAPSPTCTNTEAEQLSKKSLEKGSKI